MTFSLLSSTSSSRRRFLNDLLVRANEWALKGTYPPDEWEEIDNRYLAAINKMERLLGLKETKELK